MSPSPFMRSKTSGVSCSSVASPPTIVIGFALNVPRVGYHRPVRRIVQVHQVGSPAPGSDRHSSAYHLPKRRNVRDNAHLLLRPATRKPEALHLVKYQDKPQLGRQIAQERQILRVSGQIPEVRQHRLDDDARQLVRVLAQNPLRRLHVVVVQRYNVLDHAWRLTQPLRNARGFHRVQRVQRRVDAYRNVLVVPVVPALDLGDLVLTGVRTGGPDCVQRPLRA